MTLDHLIAGAAAMLGGAGAQLFVNRRLRNYLMEHFNGIYRRLGRIDQRLDNTPVPIPNTDPGSVLKDFEPLSQFDKTFSGKKP